MAGDATSNHDTHYIAVNAAKEPHALSIIYHEDAHLFLGQTSTAVPLWLIEGLVEFVCDVRARQAGPVP